ncbi:ATP-binding protein [Sulfuricella sp.]|uniref:ATP-binding protein n=1 Tax=Sulfuricella sp. TaxID=2099377 RepID=UPI002D12D3BA|nr:ATP-binding protein [Sulfuricella sp.]HUX64041.1 ATP-binding protein [Sulfuricella sp.]
MTKIFDSATDCKLLYSSPVQNESALILLRSRLSAIAQRLGLSDQKRENMLLVASEMVSNQVKHANGRGLFQVWQQPGPILDILALDFGPGISCLSQARQDGYSSANTLGKGLGSIYRLSDESFVYTQQESIAPKKKWSGTVFLSRFRPGGKKNDYDKDTSAARGGAAALEIGLFSRSLSDNRYNGDRIYLQKTGDTLRWLHLDGLGHGEQAQAATANLASHLSHCDTPASVLAAVDRQLKGTRGAVAIIGELGLASKALNILGVGDMHAHVMDDEDMYNLSFAPGVLGKEHQNPAEFSFAFGKRCLMISASDGIRRNWDVSNFPGLFHQHPQLIAYTLGNIMGRISDDQSLCVASID